MGALSYLAVLLFIGVCGVGVLLGFRLSLPWERFIKVDLFILFIYLNWDFWAVRNRDWFFDEKKILNFPHIIGLPIEEILFFIVVPFTTVAVHLAVQKLSQRARPRD